MTEDGFDADGHPLWVGDERLATYREALERVIDPELGYNIVGLGLVYGVAADADGKVNIEMTTTTMGCPATDYLLSGAQNSLVNLPGVTSVEVDLTYDPPWTPDMMEPMAKDRFGIR
jgi:metal-sulfur cluster biosynthetic enzyme